MKICSICQREFTEWGNNAWPVNTGKCCNACDIEVIIPARIRIMQRAEKLIEKEQAK